jgi:hypothetical protein
MESVEGCRLQIWTYSFYVAAFIAISGLLMLYALVKTCAGGPGSRTERRGGVPREEEFTSTSAAYGAEVSYLPGTGSADHGPFPVGGRQERPPTRSFRDYFNPRKKEKEE